MNTFKLTQFKAKTNIEKDQGRTPRHYKTMRIGLVLAAMMFGGVFYGLATMHTPETEAIEPSEFNAGYLIDDSVFYNPNTMTAEEIQNFLDAKSPACDMWGTGLISGRRYPDETWVPVGTTRAQYAKVMREKYGKTQYHDPPYVCINKYYENPETHQSLYETQGVATAGMKSAAQIIYDVAQEYSINPQVLLVLLKKESSVWGDNWPLKNQYNTVMGYGCPDNAPCNEAYYGFYNQVQKAAWQLKYYREHPTSYRYKSGQNNNIQYHPNIACGTKQVYLENIATTSLYIYTPYTPNDAALRAYPGTGDGCSSYGNRNFYMFFREWFGSTYTPEYVAMSNPRTMTISSYTMYIDTRTGETISEPELFTGEHLYFNSKVDIYHNKSKQACLRTQEDAEDGISRCILMARLKDFDLDDIPQKEGVYYADRFTCPINLSKMSVDCETPIEKDAIIRASKEVSVGGINYILDASTNYWFLKERFNTYTIDWLIENSTDFLIPRSLYTDKTDNVINVATLEKCEINSTNLINYFTKKVVLNEKTYFLIDDGASGCGVEVSKTQEVSSLFSPFAFPRNLIASKDYEMTPVFGNEDCASGKKGDKLFFNTKIDKDGISYFRPSTVSVYSSCAINADALSEL